MKSYNEISSLLLRARQIAEHLEEDQVRGVAPDGIDVDLNTTFSSTTHERTSKDPNNDTSSKSDAVDDAATEPNSLATLPDARHRLGDDDAATEPNSLATLSDAHHPFADDDAATEPDSLAGSAQAYDPFAEEEEDEEHEKQRQLNADKDNESKMAAPTILRVKL